MAPSSTARALPGKNQTHVRASAFPTRANELTVAAEHWAPKQDDDDDDVAEEVFNNKEATLFLIESTPTMLDPDAGSSAPLGSALSGTPGASLSTDGHRRCKLEIVLRSAYAMMKRKVVSAPKDFIGIAIFNTAELSDRGGGQPQHIMFPLSLGQPTALSIRELRDLLAEVDQNPQLFIEMYSTYQGDNTIGTALQACNRELGAHAPGRATKRIFLITDNDDPSGDDERVVNSTRNIVKDIRNMGYGVEPFFVPAVEGLEFDVDKFYNAVLSVEGDEDSFPRPAIQSSLNAAMGEMVANMKNKEYIKRKLWSIPFTIGEGFVIGINGYSLAVEQKLPTPQKVDLDSSQARVVVSETMYNDAVTGEQIVGTDMIKTYMEVGKADPQRDFVETGPQQEYGDSGTQRGVGGAGTQRAVGGAAPQRALPVMRIFFTAQDMQRIKTLGRPTGLTLLGFQPRVPFLKFHQSVKHAYFIYPDETAFAGSTCTFASLLLTMLEKDKIGIACLIARKHGRPVHVVLVPQAEELDPHSGVATRPGGIHLCHLPYADDMRALDIEKTPSVLTQDPDDDTSASPAIDTAKKIVKHLTRTSYIPDMYPNPALNYFLDTLASLALGDDKLPEPVDATIPKYASIDDRVGEHILKLRSLISITETDTANVVVSKHKRVADTVSIPTDLEAFAEEFKEVGAKMTNARLKEACRTMDLKLSGTKAELMERVTEALVERELFGVLRKKKRKVKKEESEEEEEGSDVEMRSGSKGKGKRKSRRDDSGEEGEEGW